MNLPKKLPSEEVGILEKLLLAFGVYLVVFFILSSSKLGYAIHRPYVGPVGFNAFPLVLLAILLTFFFLQYRKELVTTQLSLSTSTQLRIALGAAVLIVIALSFWATHPPIERYEAMHAYIRNNPVTGGPTLAASLYTALFLPLPALLLFALPALRAKLLRNVLLFGALLFIAYLYANVAEAYFHLAFSPVLFGAVEQLLHTMGSEISTTPNALQLQLDEFAVIIGPVCTGFSMFTLFVGLFLYMWHERALEPLRASLALAIGVILLFFVNILRIASIVLIGSKYPGMGVALFHDTAGSVLFFFVFMAYLVWVMPFIQKTKK